MYIIDIVCIFYKIRLLCLSIIIVYMFAVLIIVISSEIKNKYKLNYGLKS